LQIMNTVFGPSAGPAAASAWDEQVSAIEHSLAVLDGAFANGEPQHVVDGAQGLHEVLTRAMLLMRQHPGAGQAPSLDVHLIQRLTQAQARARAHQQAVLRGRVATERTLNVLLPREGDSTYQSLGGAAGRVAATYR
jgi:hypothetical protein